MHVLFVYIFKSIINISLAVFAICEIRCLFYFGWLYLIKLVWFQIYFTLDLFVWMYISSILSTQFVFIFALIWLYCPISFYDDKKYIEIYVARATATIRCVYMFPKRYFTSIFGVSIERHFILLKNKIFCISNMSTNKTFPIQPMKFLVFLSSI